ncbi:MAG: hypothetical protein IGS03_00565 [Candidatus Sericytochromatia bacterium]|nr:hypothetical protein [Candidatus Sericytochromatia bacterium]
MNWELDMTPIIREVLKKEIRLVLKEAIDNAQKEYEAVRNEIIRQRARANCIYRIVRETLELLDKDELYELDCNKSLDYIYRAKKNMQGILQVHFEDFGLPGDSHEIR